MGDRQAALRPQGDGLAARRLAVALLGGAALVLAAAVVWRGIALSEAVSLRLRTSRLCEALLSGDATAAADAAGAVGLSRPEFARALLFRACALAELGDFKGGALAARECETRAAGADLRAEAELARAVCVVLGDQGRDPAALAEARAVLEKLASGGSSVWGDAAVALGVLDLARGDVEAAKRRVAALGEKRPLLGLEATGALHALEGCLLGPSDRAGARSRYAAAALVTAGRKTPLARHVVSVVEALDLEAALDPAAPANLKARLMDKLASQGERAIADPTAYPVYLRAALIGAFSPVRPHRDAAMKVVDRAVSLKPQDAEPLLVRANALIPPFEALWKEAAENAAIWARQAPSASGAPPDRRNPALERVEAAEGPLLDALRKAAEISAAKDPGLAWSLGSYVFRWKLAAAQLTTSSAERRARDLAAAGACEWCAKLAGDGLPMTPEWAPVLAGAGALLERQGERARAATWYERSLKADPAREDVRAAVSGERPPVAVAATYPARGRARPSGGEIPPIGVELSLPGHVRSLEQCRVEVRAGPEGKPEAARELRPVLAGTGVWCLPKAGDLPEGLLEARFAVVTPEGDRAEAAVRFAADRSGPVVMPAHPLSGAALTERHPIFRFRWIDPSGLAPELLSVVLEPVAVQFFTRQQLVERGRHRAPRTSGDVTWKAGDAAAPGEGAQSGEVACSTRLPLAEGTYRLRVTLADSLGNATEKAWEFQVR